VLHCASGGATEAIEAINRTNARHWREHNAKAEEKCFIKRPDPPVNIVGGYKFPGAPAADLNPSDAKPVSAPSPTARLLIDDSLDIPNFLRRASFDAPQRSNADAIRASAKSLPDAQTDPWGKGPAAGMALRGRSLVQPTRNNCAKGARDERQG
jgi:hypothetical protein